MSKKRKRIVILILFGLRVVKSGTVMRITTGAPVPKGADAVVQVCANVLAKCSRLLVHEETEFLFIWCILGGRYRAY